MRFLNELWNTCYEFNFSVNLVLFRTDHRLAEFVPDIGLVANR
jgi:hypothetical protein